MDENSTATAEAETAPAKRKMYSVNMTRDQHAYIADLAALRGKTNRDALQEIIDLHAKHMEKAERRRAAKCATP